MENKLWESLQDKHTFLNYKSYVIPIMLNRFGASLPTILNRLGASLGRTEFRFKTKN